MKEDYFKQVGKITCGEKMFSGKIIFTDSNKNRDIIILKMSSVDKFLVFLKTEDKAHEFYVTGMDKIYEIIDFLKKGVNLENISKQIKVATKQIKSKYFVKNLKRFDTQKIKKALADYYDDNYSQFIILGIKYNEFLETAENETAF